MLTGACLAMALVVLSSRALAEKEKPPVVIIKSGPTISHGDEPGTLKPIVKSHFVIPPTGGTLNPPILAMNFRIILESGDPGVENEEFALSGTANTALRRMTSWHVMLSPGRLSLEVNGTEVSHVDSPHFTMSREYVVYSESSPISLERYPLGSWKASTTVSSSRSGPVINIPVIPQPVPVPYPRP